MCDKSSRITPWTYLYGSLLVYVFTNGLNMQHPYNQLLVASVLHDLILPLAFSEVIESLCK